MAKKLLALLLCAAMLSTALLSCAKPHTHTFADTWSTSADEHWRAATCEHEERAEVGEHRFGESVLAEDGVRFECACEVCGYVKSEAHVHVYGEWSVTTPATVLAEGEEVRTCTFVSCGASESRAIARVEIVSLNVSAIPQKLTYTVGESFDASGLAVCAVGADGSMTDVTALIALDKSVLAEGDASVTASFAGQSVSFAISVLSQSNHPHCFRGEWETLTPATILAEGQKYRVCDFDGCTERELAPLPRIEVTGIAVTAPPAKTEYAEGERFSPAGLVITATGADGSTADVTALVSFDKSMLSSDDGQITVTYAGKTATVAIRVRVVSSVAQALAAADAAELLVQGIFVGVADEGSGYAKELMLKDTAGDKLIAVHGVPYGSFPDYGYDKGDLVRLSVSVVREVYVEGDTKTENKTWLSFADDNPQSAEQTVLSRGNAVSWDLSRAVELDSWTSVKNLFKAESLQAYTLVHFKGATWFNTYCAAGDGVPLHRICMTSSGSSLAKIKPDGTRALGLRQNMLEANVPSAMTTFFADYLGSTDYPGKKASSMEFYAVVTETNSVNYQLTILDSSWLVGNEEKIEIKTQQDIVKEVGMAFYRQGDQIFYDQRYRDENCVPECASAQQQLYLDCSSFVNSVYYEAFGINIQRVPISERIPQTGNYANYAKNHLNDPEYPEVIGYWETADYTTEAEQTALFEQVYGMLQVGDVVNYRHGKSSDSSGHALLYIGNGTFLHSTGSQATYENADPTKNKDICNAMEITHGTVQTLAASALFTSKTSSRYLFRNDSSDKMYNFCVLRPLNRGLTATEKTERRMSIAGLSLEKTVQPGLRAAVERGGLITYTLRIENHSSNVYTDLLFEDILSPHISFVSGSEGLVVQGQRVSKSISVGAWEVVTLRWTARVNADAALGARIESADTTLNGFSVCTDANVVGRYTAEQLAAVAQRASELAAAGTSYADPIALANELYRELSGGDLFTAENAAALMEEVFRYYGTSTTYFDLDPEGDYFALAVPRLYNGTLIHRLDTVTSLHRQSDFMQGDLIFCEQKGVQYLFVYVGAGQFVRVTTANTTATVVENGKESIQRIDNTYCINSLTSQLRTFERCVILRPTQGG